MLCFYPLLNYTFSGHHCEIYTSGVPSSNLYSDDAKLKHNIDWPQMHVEKPINELTTKGYIVRAFPVLFPYGKGDLCVVQNNNLSPRVYFQYLMDFHDGRFSSHKIFPYFALNSVMRWECLSKGTVYIKERPDLKSMNVEVLKDLIADDPNFMKDVMVYGSNIRGTREFWSSKSIDLESMCDSLGIPTIFFTVSAADHHWPKLKELILQYVNMSNVSETEYCKLIYDNPKICSDYFYKSFVLFFENIVLGCFEVVDHWYRFEWQVSI